jgi:hypothetical protein
MKKIYSIVFLLFLVTNLFATVNISNMSEKEIHFHDKCLKLSQTKYVKNNPDRWQSIMTHKGCKNLEFYKEYKEAKIRQNSVNILNMSEKEIHFHDKCLKYSKSRYFRNNSNSAMWKAVYVRQWHCKELSFYPKYEKAKIKYKKQLEEKRRQEKLAQEKAKQERIAKIKAQRLVIAKKHGFNSYKEYLSDLRKKDQEKKEKLAKSKGFNSYAEYQRALYAKKYPYQAIIGCGKIGGRIVPVSFCLESFKLNGRFVFRNSGDMYYKYGNPSQIKIGLPSKFLVMLSPSNDSLYYLKIIDSRSGKELFYDEKQNKYSVIKVKN